jgi:hypothetical protein
MQINLEQEPLSILEKISSGFGHRYRSLEQRKLERRHKKAADSEAEVEKLETLDHDLFLWKDARDGRVDQVYIDDGALSL